MKSQNLLRKISNSIGLPLEIDQGLSSQNFQYKLPSPITSIRNFQEFIDLLEKSIPDQIDESVEDYREDNFSPDVLAYYRSFRISLSNPDHILENYSRPFSADEQSHKGQQKNQEKTKTRSLNVRVVGIDLGQFGRKR